MLELYDKGYTSDHIVCETGLARTTVDRYIRTEHGRRTRPHRMLDEQIMKLYNEGVRLDDIGTRLNVPNYYIDNILKRLHAEGAIGWRYEKCRKLSE